jgi:cell division transport system permease protein
MKTFKTSWKHIRRSPYQALAAIFIMMLTFLALSVFSFVIIGSTKIISYFESKPQVTAFFKEETKSENITALAEQVKASGKVAEVTYVSKKEALAIYKQQNKDDPLLLELVTEDILPASLEISTVKIEDLAPVSETLKTSPYVSEVIFQRDVVSQLTKWTDAIRKIGIVIIILLSLVSVFIMATIIGFKISQKREEIEIMRLLSATKWYVRWPFIVEGMFYGVIGALIGWAIASAGLLYATPYLQSFLGSIPLLPVSFLFLLALLGVELLIAVILGSYASFLAVLRYLK